MIGLEREANTEAEQRDSAADPKLPMKRVSLSPQLTLVVVKKAGKAIMSSR